jgi:hypothetical protein
MNFEKEYYTFFPMTRNSFSLDDRWREKNSLCAQQSNFFLACGGLNRCDKKVLPANFL